MLVCTWYPECYPPEQKEMRVIMSRDLIEMVDTDDSFLRKTKQELRHGAFFTTLRLNVSLHNVSQKFRFNRSQGKIMLGVIFDYRGLIHYEFIPEGSTV